MTRMDVSNYGNPYQQTNTGKKYGTVLGAGVGAAAAGRFAYKLVNNSDTYSKLAEDFVQRGGKDAAKFMNKFKKLKFAFPAAALLTGGLLAGAVGRLVGGIYDKISNRKNKIQADNPVQNALNNYDAYNEKSDKLRATMDNCDMQLAEINNLLSETEDGSTKTKLLQRKEKLEELRTKVFMELIDAA